MPQHLELICNLVRSSYMSSPNNVTASSASAFNVNNVQTNNIISYYEPFRSYSNYSMKLLWHQGEIPTNTNQWQMNLTSYAFRNPFYGLTINFE